MAFSPRNEAIQSHYTSKQDRRKGILQDSRDQQQWCNLKLKAMATGWVNYGQLSLAQAPLILRARPLPRMTCQTALPGSNFCMCEGHVVQLWLCMMWNIVKQLKVRSLSLSLFPSLTFINIHGMNIEHAWIYDPQGYNSFHLQLLLASGAMKSGVPLTWSKRMMEHNLVFHKFCYYSRWCPYEHPVRLNPFVWEWPCATETELVICIRHFLRHSSIETNIFSHANCPKPSISNPSPGTA